MKLHACEVHVLRSIESEAADQLLRSPTEKCQVHLQRDVMAGI